MFFICGMRQGKKLLDYKKAVICGLCGGYGRYQVFMTYSYFSVLLIPVLKWDRHYYVQMSCCNTIYELSTEKGKILSHREAAEIERQELTLVEPGKRTSVNNLKKCINCGYETTEDFKYCPKCGQKL